jgi:hypothetical protein
VLHRSVRLWLDCPECGQSTCDSDNVHIDELTASDVVPEPRGLGMNDERKSQSRGRTTGVVGGDIAGSNLMSNWSNVEAIMVINSQGRRVSRGTTAMSSSNEMSWFGPDTPYAEDIYRGPTLRGTLVEG